MGGLAGHTLENITLHPWGDRALSPMRSEVLMAGQGSTGNVIAALASFFIPGLGQLIQGRLIRAGVMFVLAAVLWLVWLGWIIHLWSILDAALWKPRGEVSI
jgi:TM2 domain-containing membrane protein YozV